MQKRIGIISTIITLVVLVGVVSADFPYMFPLGFPEYSISGYVKSYNGTVLDSVYIVDNQSRSLNTSISTGFYELAQVYPNGVYNLTFSRTGYVTGYLEVSVSGSNLLNQNITLNFSDCVMWNSKTLNNSSSVFLNVSVEGLQVGLSCLVSNNFSFYVGNTTGFWFLGVFNDSSQVNWTRDPFISQEGCYNVTYLREDGGVYTWVVSVESMPVTASITSSDAYMSALVFVLIGIAVLYVGLRCSYPYMTWICFAVAVEFFILGVGSIVAVTVYPRSTLVLAGLELLQNILFGVIAVLVLGIFMDAVSGVVALYRNGRGG